jgi:SSS family transporter
MVWKWMFMLAYISAVIAIGISQYSKVQDKKDFYLAGRNLTLFWACGSSYAAYMSAAVMLSITGYAYVNGWATALSFGLGLTTATLVILLMAPKFRGKLWYTSPSMYGDRYGDYMRLWMAVFRIIASILWIGFQTIGSSIVLSAFLGVPYNIAAISVAVIVVVYSSLGGLKSVVKTDVLQGFLLLVGLVTATAIAFGQAGGFAGYANALALIDNGRLLTLDAGGNLPISFVLGMSFAFALQSVTLDREHRLIYSCVDNRTAFSYIGFVVPFVGLTYILACLLGTSIRIIVPGLADPASAVPVFAASLNPLLGSLIMAGVAAAIMSTVDSIMLNTATVVTNEFYTKYVNPNASDAQVVRVARIVMICLGLIGLAITISRVATIIQIHVLISRLASVVIFPALFLGFYCKRVNEKGAISGSLIGTAAFLILDYGKFISSPDLIAIPLGFLVILIVSYLTEAPAQEKLEPFFPSAKNITSDYTTSG